MQKSRKPIVASFLILFGVLVGAAGLRLLTQPEMYRATARVKFDLATLNLGQGQGKVTYRIDAPATDFELVGSETILGRVIEELDLNRKWGERSGNGQGFRTSESLVILRERLSMRRVNNTTLLDIQFLSESPAESALVANKIAEVCGRWAMDCVKQQMSTGWAEPSKDRRSPKEMPFMVLERAMPPSRPIRPSGPIAAALVLSSLVTGVTLWGCGIWMLLGLRHSNS
ncbi:MAG TPA: hypothetical protein VFZ59_18230 [Verrucomicrobiae bacterium]|nr:hypothetical protein [Verrucomicrobiae bacterium]